MDYNAEIDRGIALLDSKVPDWREVIDKDSLEMSSPTRCILGMVFGTYRTGLDELGLTAGHRHGFSLPDDVEADYRELTQAWRARLGVPPRW